MSPAPVNLYSDTQTRPTDGMRHAIATAEVGDEQRGLDPTVNALQERVAELLGQDAALFLPSGSMCNEISIRLHTRPGGDEYYLHRTAHPIVAEAGGPAFLSGAMIRTLEGEGGMFTPDELEGALRAPGNRYEPRSRLVSVEQTTNLAGGRVWTRAGIDAVLEVARKHGLRVHLDGARLMNAAVASGVPAAEIGGQFDTVTLCLSKGLGCPTGALVAGSAERMKKARRFKFLFGGAMRQAGIIAAAGVYAFDNHIDRLADDHRHARRLAEGLVAAGLPVDLDQVETNFVQLDVGRLDLTSAEAIAKLREAGVGMSVTIHPNVLRAVTHLDISDEDIETAIEAVPRALGVLVAG